MPAPGAVQIAALDNRFEPPHLEVRAGTLVRWQNQGTDDHDVVAEDLSFESPVLKPGETFERDFSAPGTFPYLCDLHEGMVGTVVVS
jgi:plastocyanin